jgi:hypothetical protein
MEGDVLVYVVLCLLVYMLGMQFQISQLSSKVMETIKKLDVLLNERLKDKNNQATKNMP